MAQVNRQALGLAAIRFIVGLVFLVHGSQKLFVYGFSGVIGAFGHMGIPMAGFFGPLVTLVEFLGGLALILGLFTRVAAGLLAIDMLVAVLAVHGKNGFFLPTGFEYALTLLVTNFGLVLAGGGAYALDNVLGKPHTSDPPLRARAA